MSKLKPTYPRTTKNSWSPWSQSGGWKAWKGKWHTNCSAQRLL